MATEITHYWVLRIDGKEFGLIEYKASFTGALDTEVHYGSGYLRIDLPILLVASIPNVLLLLACAVFYYSRCRRHRAKPTKADASEDP